MNAKNLIFTLDSYKFGHHKSYPKDLEYLYSYMESRGGVYSETVFYGLQYYLKEYLSKQITAEDVNYAEERVNKHMGPGIFNREGWMRIVTEHNGYLPLKIKAVPEGTVVPNKNVLLTIESTDKKLVWLTNAMETLILKVWYPITVATVSRECKKVILKYLEETGDPTGIDFKLHCFGYRGVSSEESAGIGGSAHLVNFKGSDTFAAIEFAKDYYDEDMAAFSIPAMEHSTVMAWGREFEYEAYENMINQFGDGALYAIVCDSYDPYKAVSEILGTMLHNKIMTHSGTLVVRPDSGVPHEVVRQIVEILGEKFGYTTNDKGFKVLNSHTRVIQGDGIDRDEIGRILEALKIRGWSADNVAFGMGGALLQKVDRDTQKFAIKASQVIRGGKVTDVYKSPTTDNGKRSKAGRLKLVRNEDGVLETRGMHDIGHDELQLVYENGIIYNSPKFSEIRERAEIKPITPAWI